MGVWPFETWSSSPPVEQEVHPQFRGDLVCPVGVFDRAGNI